MIYDHQTSLFTAGNAIGPDYLKDINIHSTLYSTTEVLEDECFFSGYSQGSIDRGYMQTEVLIVEDEGVSALSLKAILLKMGYRVAGIAITGHEAISMTRELKPDIILMDIHIKGEMDGIAATEQISNFTDIPVIYLTAYADNETVQRAIKTKSHSYLVKPYNPRELYSNIEFAIYKYRLKYRIGSHRENLELALTKMSDSGIIFDIAGKIVYANSAAEVLTGYHTEELKDKNIFHLLNLAVSQADSKPDDNLSRILSLGAIDYFPAFACIQTKSGKKRTIALKTGIVRDDADDPRYILALMSEYRTRTVTSN